MALLSVAEALLTRGTLTLCSRPFEEVVLDGGYKTLVRPGELPVMPVRNEAELNRNRAIKIHKKNAPDTNPAGTPSMDMLAHDNDRRNRTSDPSVTSNSRTNTNTERAKPTLSFPQ